MNSKSSEAMLNRLNIKCAAMKINNRIQVWNDMRESMRKL